MKLMHFYVREDQKESLKTLKGNMSEHIRFAIDDYLLKKQKEKLNVSKSMSK